MGANFGDIDNDGFLDMYLGTGAPAYSFLVPNVMYRSVGGERFADVTLSAGVGHLQKGHAVAFGDLDGDGDQDIYHQLGGFYADDGYSNVLYENPGNDHSWLTVRVVGTISNRAGFGARIRVRVDGPDGPRDLHRVVGVGGSFGGNTLQQEIGLGTATTVLELEVTWPASGLVQTFEGLAVNRFVEVVEGRGDPQVSERPIIPLLGGTHAK